MTSVVSFYNHKGGVSKTTTTFNLAHLLADEGKKVLVVDADPQCNMTELMLANALVALDADAARLERENELPGTSLLDILKPRLEGSVPEIEIDEVKVVNVRENLDLVRGDVALSSVEDWLVEAHSQRFSNKTHEKRTYVAMGDFLTRIGEKAGYAYILLDVGPSSGALTRYCFLACDAFFIPVSPDRFNVQAISTLSSIIDRWIFEHSQIYEDFLRVGLPVKHGKPHFLGTVMQHFKILKGRPKPGYQLWIKRIPANVDGKLFPVLRKYSSADNDLTGGLSNDTISVTEIPDFGQLGPLMQEYGKAVFHIEAKDTAIITESGAPWGGGTWTDAERRMAEYRSKYVAIEARMEWLKK